jgi:squalene synthase HpnC
MSNSLHSVEAGKGYLEALRLAAAHYENFPVVSFLIPKHLRKDVAMLYWFARTADDIADEGELSIKHKLETLDAFEVRFSKLIEGDYETNVEAALDATIQSRQLTPKYFTDLLSAFRQDITKTRYADMVELLDYCRRSANPVGRLMLEVFDIRDEKAREYSDAVCTALQLTNFWQDVSVDIAKGRVYIPVDMMEKYHVTESMIISRKQTAEYKSCMCELVRYTQELFAKGIKLLPFLSNRFRLEIAWTINGGRKILAKIEKINYYTVSERVELSRPDIIGIILKSLVELAGIGKDNSERK